MSDAGTYVSLFSGIGGLDLAIEAFGYRCVGQVEWDRSCSDVLGRWWPDTPRWGDVATYPNGQPGSQPYVRPTGEIGTSRRGDVSGLGVDGIVGGGDAAGSPDIVVGGFP